MNAESQEDAASFVKLSDEGVDDATDVVQASMTADKQPVAIEAPEPSWVFAVGRIQARVSSLAIEREFVQVIGAEDTGGLTDSEAFQKALSTPENRYLARQLCWVFTIAGIDTYVLQVRSPQDVGWLIDAIRPTPRPTDIDVIVGVRGPLSDPAACGGLVVPTVAIDHLYSFDVDKFLDAVVESGGEEKLSARDKGRLRQAAEEVFTRISQVADNSGASAEHRALNYLAVRYPPIYTHAAKAYENSIALTSVYAQPSPLTGTRDVLEVIFSFTNRRTDVTEEMFARVDVTEEFPFVVSKLAPYISR